MGRRVASLRFNRRSKRVDWLVMGLWNRLTRHQDRSSPFRLMRIDSAPTREGLAALALMRRQELEGFIEGFRTKRCGRLAGARPSWSR